MSDNKTPPKPVPPPAQPLQKSYNYGERVLTEVVTFHTTPPAPPPPPKEGK